MRVAMLMNNPPPYRVPVFDRLAERLEGFKMFYCCRREPDREWNVGELRHDHVYLPGKAVAYRGRSIHFNLGVWRELKRYAPQVVITSGFNPTMLIAWLYACWKGVAHMVFADGWARSEAVLSPVHHLVRRIVYRRTAAFVGASVHTMEMFARAGIPESAIFQSQLCVDNRRFRNARSDERPYDVMFSGRIVPRKLPHFFAAVASGLAQRRGGLRALVLGSGPDEAAMRESMEKESRLSVDFAGYLRQEDLPERYAAARLLLFPTEMDPWGVVANEACAAGTPVVTCEAAGAAGDLVVHGDNGLVLPIDSETWIDEVDALLSDQGRWERMSARAQEAVRRFDFDAAAEGVVKASRYATTGAGQRRRGSAT
jgi:glycosyltransferase involved in cell wall biosynthesis